MLHFRGGDPAESLYLSQRDIRELQFAKAAIATGWTLLLEEQGLTAADVAQVVLAGSFGSYLAPSAAVRIGLVPEVATLRIVSAGNVAGEGAKMALLSDARTGRRPGPAGGGALRRALRPCRLQRPVRRPTRLPLSPSSGSRSWRAGRSPGTSPTSPSAGAGPSTSTRCRRCCTTARSASPPRSSRRVTRLRPPLRAASRWATPTAAPTAALDEVCARLEVRRLPGAHCYDVFAGAERFARAARRRAGHVRAHRLPRDVVPPARSSSSSASTATPSCATPTSATTGASSGSPSTPPTGCAPRRSGRPSSSVCRWRPWSWATRSWKRPWPSCSPRQR